jgi:hypothetical protein
VDSRNHATVYIPIIGPTLGQGFIEIHGLIQENLANVSTLQRSNEFLQAMITAKDYR